MKFSLTLTCFAAVALTSAARADVVVRAPFVRVQVGPGVYVRAPFVRVVVPPRAPTWPTILPAPEVVYPGSPPPVPLYVPSAPVPPVGKVVKAPTVEELARTFKPLARGGKYEVVVEHPHTAAPVTVAFELPPGAPRRVVARKNELVFRYGPLRAVVIQFNRDGSYQVRG